MGHVIRVKHAGGILLGENNSIEMVAAGNNEPGKDGNFRIVIEGGKNVQQKLINGTWTILKALS